MEAFRSRGTVSDATATGTYTMTTANAGTMSLSARQTDTDEPQTLVQNYRFLVAGNTGMEAVRTDAGVMGTSSFSPAKVSADADVSGFYAIRLDPSAVAAASIEAQ